MGVRVRVRVRALGVRARVRARVRVGARGKVLVTVKEAAGYMVLNDRPV